jgi:TetR/AcrR family transcriptional regulator, ethionamide resistance regulator
MVLPSHATGPTTSPRRRRPGRISGEQRERAILTTLQELLAREPLHAISVDDLARGAGISRPTFYFYFASKEAALLALLDVLVEEAWEALQDAPSLLMRDPAAAWRKAIGGSYATWTANRDVIRAAAEARTSNADVQALWTGLLESLVEQTARAIEAERARGAAPEGIPARDLALCLNRMNERVFETKLGDEELTLADDRLLDTLVEIWLRSIYGAPTRVGPGH